MVMDSGTKKMCVVGARPGKTISKFNSGSTINHATMPPHKSLDRQYERLL